MNSKKWVISFLIVFIVGLSSIALFNIIIDPFFHFHKPLAGLQYPMKEERYINDGIQRNFDYEVLIIGTSEAQNFNASEIEGLWKKKTVKTCYSGASFHELSESIKRAIEYNPELDTVICSLDPNFINAGAEEDNYSDYPIYLYDRNPFNDVKYIYNKEVITSSIAVLNYTRSGQKTPDFDEYGRFDTYIPSGKDAVLRRMDTSDTTQYNLVITDEDKRIIEENIVENYIKLAEDNKDIRFIFFFPPYSYCYWESLQRTGQLNFAMDVMEYATGLMMNQVNIELYSYMDHKEIVTNLDYYMDDIHYNGTVCDIICNYIKNGEGLLTESNYHEFFSKIKQLYSEMDYSDLRQIN